MGRWIRLLLLLSLHLLLLRVRARAGTALVLVLVMDGEMRDGEKPEGEVRIGVEERGAGEAEEDRGEDAGRGEDGGGFRVRFMRRGGTFFVVRSSLNDGG